MDAFCRRFVDRQNDVLEWVDGQDESIWTDGVGFGPGERHMLQQVYAYDYPIKFIADWVTIRVFLFIEHSAVILSLGFFKYTSLVLKINVQFSFLHHIWVNMHELFKENTLS